MDTKDLDTTALGLTNPYEYLPPLQTLYRSHNSTKKATSLTPKEKAKKRRAKRKAQRHNR
jgi:hypothetical protein